MSSRLVISFVGAEQQPHQLNLALRLLSGYSQQVSYEPMKSGNSTSQNRLISSGGIQGGVWSQTRQGF